MDDQQQIENVINIYIDSMNESNADMVRDAFHENAKITGYLHGELKQLSTEEFAGFVSSQQPSLREGGLMMIIEANGDILPIPWFGWTWPF